jgi:ParB family chromosome partitioning protein
MPRENSAGRISFRPLDDLFEPTVEQPMYRETLPTNLSPDRLKPFPNHPFKVVQDGAMRELVESVRENGVIEPILCRPDGEGGYQIISGHRRQTAAMLAGLSEVPVSVREMDDHTATIVMVDSNLHRPTILPSEKAFAFKMKLAALEEKRSMGLIVSNGRRSTEMVGEETGDNYRNVMRYLRLTELTPKLLQLVDSGRLKFHPAVELSYLKPAEQETLHTVIAETQRYPTLTQAKALKQFSKASALNKEKILLLLRGEKALSTKITFSIGELRDFFPSNYSAGDIREAIFDILEARQRCRAGKER